MARTSISGWRDEDSRAWRVARWAMLGVIVTAIARPFFLSTWYGNDEIDRYPGRLEVLFQHASFAHPLPRWIPELAGGHGYPLFDFFNPGSMAMALPLRALGLDPFLSIKITLIGMLLVGGAHAMWLAERVFGRAAGMPAAALYLLAPYTLANLYYRGDYAELWASLLFPAVAYHALALYQTRRARYFFALALGWALLVPAHAFSALLFAIGFAVPWTLGLLRNLERPGDRRRGIVLVLLASSLGVAMAAIYWLPALLEKHSVHIDTFFSVERLMGSALSGDDILDPTPEGRGAAGRRLTLGLWIPVLLVSALVLSWARPRVPRRGLMLGLVLGCAFALLMTTQAGEPFYRALPLIGQILFPFRFLSIATFLAVLGASQLPRLLGRRRALAAASAITSATILPALSYLVVLNPIDLPPEHSNFAGRAQYQFVFFDYGEYFPVGAVAPPLFVELSPYRADRFCVVEDFTFTDLRHAFRVQASRPCQVTLRQMYWLGWHATIDGAPLQPGLDRGGRMVLAIPAGEHRLAVWWEETLVERLATIVTWIALALFLVLVLLRAGRADWRDNLRAWARARRRDPVGQDRLQAETQVAAAETAYFLGLEGAASELAGRALGTPGAPGRSGAIGTLVAARRTWPTRFSVRVALALGICSATVVIALWPRPREVAHTELMLGGDPTFGAERAIDGMDETQWLLPDRSPGRLDVELLPPRRVSEIEIVNAHDLEGSPRSTERYRIEARAGDRVVVTHEGTLDRGGRATIAVGAEIDRVSFWVVSFRGLGGGLTELRVR